MGRNGSVKATGRSTAVLAGYCRPSMSTEWANPEEDKHDGGSRTRWEYSERGKAAYMGKRRDRLSCWSRETFPAHPEVGEECPHNWIRSQRRQSQTQRCASPRWRFAHPGVSQRDLEANEPSGGKRYRRRDNKGVRTGLRHTCTRAVRTLEARGLSGSTGTSSGDIQRTRQGRDEAVGNSHSRGPPAAEIGRAHIGSGV